MADLLKANVRWIDGHRFLATTGSRFSFVLDNPSREGAAGPSPMEAVLAALAGCTGIDVVSILEKMHQPLERLELAVEGDRREEHPRIYTSILVTYKVWGEKLDPGRVARAVALSEENYCSVSGMLKDTTPIKTRIELNGAEIPTGHP